MLRYIPGRTRVKSEIAKGFTWGDLILLVIGLAGALIFVYTNLPYKWYILIGWAVIIITLFLPMDDGLRLWSSIGLLFRFFAFRKKYAIMPKTGKLKGYRDIKEITPFLKIDLGRFINFGSYYGMVIEIKPVGFGLMSEDVQDALISTFGRGLKRLSNLQSASIVKLRKPMRFDKFMQNDDEKFQLMNTLAERGQYNEQEVQARSYIFEERVRVLDNANKSEPVLQDHYYLVVYGADRTALEDTCIGIMNDIGAGQASLKSEILKEREIVTFLKSNYQEIFDETEVENIIPKNYLDWIMPKKIEFKPMRTVIDKKIYRNFSITDYPLTVGNGWGFNLFNLNGSRVVMNFTPIDRDKAEKMIDRTIMEKEIRLSRISRRSKLIEQETDIQTLQQLLADLRNKNEQLYDVNIHIRVQESDRKEARTILRQDGFKYSEMFGRQVDAFISSNISKIDTIKQYRRGIPNNSLAASFPFISNLLQDEKGFYIGDGQYPVFVDFFKRDRERVNSNMMIVGKSGSGKSFATKTLLANLAADRTKIFICDPEYEYQDLTLNLGGKVINVGTNTSGILNPFHIMASLEDLEEFDTKQDDEEGVEEVTTSSNKAFVTHLQFLEQFFRVVLNGIDTDSFEMLNSLIVETYKLKGINYSTDISKLTANDYPIFDDLYALINKKLDKAKNDYQVRCLNVLHNYIEKFATGGRNADLWNGPTSIMTNENFITFNFQTLFASENTSLANAQMLLVFKYLTNEIINNKDFNQQYYKTYGEKINRQVVVVVDEAHMFIDPQFPIALSFMSKMAKRIRKYQGMQIIITQNIKDFLGSADIERKSAAIINASQYSMIFQLAPNDMADLLNLYKSAGGLNQDEQEGIVSAGLGRCFLISGPLSRTFVDVNCLPVCKQIIGEA